MGLQSFVITDIDGCHRKEISVVGVGGKNLVPVHEGLSFKS